MSANDQSTSSKQEKIFDALLLYISDIFFKSITASKTEEKIGKEFERDKDTRIKLCARSCWSLQCRHSITPSPGRGWAELSSSARHRDFLLHLDTSLDLWAEWIKWGLRCVGGGNSSARVQLKVCIPSADLMIPSDLRQIQQQDLLWILTLHVLRAELKTSKVQRRARNTENRQSLLESRKKKTHQPSKHKPRSFGCSAWPAVIFWVGITTLILSCPSSCQTE